MDVTFRHSARGFTLLELIIVLIIASVVAVMVLIKWPSTSLNLNAQAEQLANDVRYAQLLSMTHGQRYYLTKVSATTYQIKNLAGTAITMAFGNTTVTLNSGITFGALTNLPNSLIAFDGKGTPYVDTGLPGTALASTATISLVSGGVTRSVLIAPETGQVVVQ